MAQTFLDAIQASGIPTGGAIYNPAAYGSIPNIPATTTNTQGWTSNIPNVTGLETQASNLIQGQMAGQLSPDVIANITQSAAERGIGTGSPGSPNTNAAFLRAMLLTSQGQQQQGLTNYMNLLSSSPRTTTETRSNAVEQAVAQASADPFSAAMANLSAQQSGLVAGQSSMGGIGGGGVSGAPATSPFALSPYTGAATGVSSSRSASGGGTGREVSIYDPSSFSVDDWLASIGWTGTGSGATGQPAAATEYTDPATGSVWGQNSNGVWINQETGETSALSPGASAEDWAALDESIFGEGDYYGDYTGGEDEYVNAEGDWYW